VTSHYYREGLYPVSSKKVEPKPIPIPYVDYKKEWELAMEFIKLFISKNKELHTELDEGYDWCTKYH
jgi:hypothetical protein